MADKTIDSFKFDRARSIWSMSKRSVGEPVEIYSAEIKDGKAFGATRLTNVKRGG